MIQHKKALQQMIPAALAVAVGLASTTAFAFDRDRGYFDYAHVDRVDRLVSVTDEPVRQQECTQVPRDEYHPSVTYRRDDNGPVTEVDANGNAVVRDEVVERGGYVTHRVDQQCVTRTTVNANREVMGYDVVYTYRGETFHDRMSHDPGRSVRVHVDHGYVELAE